MVVYKTAVEILFVSYDSNIYPILDVSVMYRNIVANLLKKIFFW